MTHEKRRISRMTWNHGQYSEQSTFCTELNELEMAAKAVLDLKLGSEVDAEPLLSRSNALATQLADYGH
jgi:hypothetical protein